MSEVQNWSKFNLGTPANYRITVRGFLDQSWSNQLGGIAIQNVSTVDDTPVTVLQGNLIDQAALFGVLNNLYGLGFPIMAVECDPVEKHVLEENRRGE